MSTSDRRHPLSGANSDEAASSPQLTAGRPESNPQLPTPSTQDTAPLPPAAPVPSEIPAPSADAPPATFSIAGDKLTLPPVPAADPWANQPSFGTTAKTEGLVPGYEILGELGRGGMGVVYKARHLKLDRLVALKMILAGGHAGSDDRERFRTEAEAIARLQHPNIVQVYDVGEHDGKPFFSLEFCPGGSLDKKLNGTPLAALEAAWLVETLSHAMHAAHARNVIHRDLKPANVLLAEDSRPKITDFGLAKKLDAAGQTQSGAIMGTPSYMAPEQAGGKSKEIGPATDVYALGAMLYELLTGRPPFKAATALDTLLQVVADEPVPPSQLQSKTPKDLETICLKCLHKEPGNRYATAAALAEDLRRFQAGETVLARPTSFAERSAKWVRRRPMVAGLLGAVLLVTCTGIAAFAWAFGQAIAARENAVSESNQKTIALQHEQEAATQAVADRQQALMDRTRAEKQFLRAEEEKKEKEKQLLRAESLIYSSQLAIAQNHFQNHDLVKCRRTLEDCQWNLRGPEYGYLRKRLAGKEVLTLRGNKDAVFVLAISSDGKRFCSGSRDGTIKVWDLETGKEIRTLSEAGGCLALSGDGKRLFAGSIVNAAIVIRVWEVDTGKETLSLRGHWGRIEKMALKGDGKRLASWGEDNQVKVWDLETGKELPTLKGEKWGSCRALGGGQWLYSDGTGGVDPGTDEVVPILRGHAGLHSVTFSGDGKRMLTVRDDGSTVQVWDLDTAKEIQTLRGQPDEFHRVALSRDGKRLFAGNRDTIKVWDIVTGKELLILGKQGGAITSLVLQGDSKRLFSASDDKTIKVWNLDAGDEPFTLHGGGAFGHTTLSGDGKRLFSGASDGIITVWNLVTGQEIGTLHGHENRVTCQVSTFDGSRLFSASDDNTVKMWDVQAGKAIRILTQGRVDSLVLSKDGTRLYAGHWDSTVTVWDPVTGQRLLSMQAQPPEPGRSGTWRLCNLVLSPDGKQLFSGSWDNTIRVWDTPTGKPTRTLSGHPGWISQLRLSGDGQRLIVATEDGQGAFGPHKLTVWDPAAGREIHTLSSPDLPQTMVVALRDGKRLFKGYGDGAIKLLDADTGKGILVLHGHTSAVNNLVVSTDEKRLVSASSDGTLKVWDLEKVKAIQNLCGQHSTRSSLKLSDDGQRLFQFSESTLKVWDLEKVK